MTHGLTALMQAKNSVGEMPGIICDRRHSPNCATEAPSRRLRSINNAINFPVPDGWPSDMIYLVSGASRSGKTLIARTILADKQIPYLSLDWLMMGFNDGLPEYGIHHLLWPNEIARKVGPFFRGMIDSMLVDGVDYVIEGEAMLPVLVADLIEKHPDKVKAVFVGYTEVHVEDKVALVRKHGDGENDWLTKESDEYIRDHVSNMIAYSKMIKADCEKHGLSYFDSSDDFPGAIEAATGFLLDPATGPA